MPEVRGGVYGERCRTETKGCGRDAGRVLGLVIFSGRRGFMAEDLAGGVVAQLGRVLSPEIFSGWQGFMTEDLAGGVVVLLGGKNNSKARC